MSEPRCVVTDAVSYSRFKDEELPPNAAATTQRTAVLVVHGMGQQRKFETLSIVAEGIEKFIKPARQKRFRNVRIGEECFSRAELDLEDGRGVDVYEAYWAPVTEGEVKLGDVMRFLRRGAWSGLVNTDKNHFARWMFGAKEWFRVGEKTRSTLLLTLCVIYSLIVLNTAALALAWPKAIPVGPQWLVAPALINDFTAMVLMFFAVAAGFVLLYFAAGRQRRRDEHPDGPLLVSRLGFHHFILTAVFTCLFALMTLFTGAFHRTGAQWSAGPIAGAVFVAVAALLLLFGTLVCIAAALRSRSMADIVSAIVLVALAVSVVTLAGVRGSAQVLEEGLPIAERSVFAFFHGLPVIPYLTATVAFVARYWIVICAALAGVSWFVRNFLVQFAGDVAAYVTPNTLDRFDQIRSRIKERVFIAADAIYRAADKKLFLYDSVVIVGHSLGSVVGYDVLNRMLNEDRYVEGKLEVLNRTKGLVTFGSPLDKTAFIFETNVDDVSDVRLGLSATVQPLISDPRTKAIPWKNVYSHWDIFAGKLNYYSKPDDQTRIDNRIDHDAVTPVGAHTEYWHNRAVWKCVSEVIPVGPAALANAGPRLPRISHGPRANA